MCRSINSAAPEKSQRIFFFSNVETKDSFELKPDKLSRNTVNSQVVLILTQVKIN